MGTQNVTRSGTCDTFLVPEDILLSCSRHQTVWVIVMSLATSFQTVLLCTGALISRHNTIELQLTNRKDATELSIQKLTKCGSFACSLVATVACKLRIIAIPAGREVGSCDNSKN